MKVTLRLPTNDPYAFIEIENEVNSIEDAHVAYLDAMKLIKGGEGLPEKEWMRCVGTYLETGTLKDGTELYQQMSKEQQFFFQTIKKYNKRVAYKNRK